MNVNHGALNGKMRRCPNNGSEGGPGKCRVIERFLISLWAHRNIHIPVATKAAKVGEEYMLASWTYAKVSQLDSAPNYGAQVPRKSEIS